MGMGRNRVKETSLPPERSVYRGVSPAPSWESYSSHYANRYGYYSDRGSATQDDLWRWWNTTGQHIGYTYSPSSQDLYYDAPWMGTHASPYGREPFRAHPRAGRYAGELTHALTAIDTGRASRGRERRPGSQSRSPSYGPDGRDLGPLGVAGSSSSRQSLTLTERTTQIEIAQAEAKARANLGKDGIAPLPSARVPAAECPLVEAPPAIEMGGPPELPECEVFLGVWADSLGHLIRVVSVDAYNPCLAATLSQPPRKDVHLRLLQKKGQWHCGNATLDLLCSSTEELHWRSADGKISVWARL